MDMRLEAAERNYIQLCTDKTSNYVSGREIWRLAYWQARVEVQ